MKEFITRVFGLIMGYYGSLFIIEPVIRQIMAS